jgi:FdhE protein
LKALTREAWLEAHPYLRPMAQLSEQVEGATAEGGVEEIGVPSWDEYRDDFLAGVPLLQSSNAVVDLEPVGGLIVALVERLASGRLSGRLAAEIAALDAELRREPDASTRVVDWLLGDETSLPSSPGLLRYVGWTAIARSLWSLVDAFGAWRNEDLWLRKYCPTCGSSPAMAQLVGVDAGRKRLLSCGRCGTRWQFGRTACPFCESDAQRLAAVTVEGEGGLRIDYCESCRGYLKTYDGQGNEALMLSDWTSLHLDLLAHDRGLKRLAASLYELEPSPSQ